MGFLAGLFGRNGKPKPVSAYLPWQAMVAPNAIVQPEGSYQRSYALRGADTTGLTPEVLGARAMQANDVLRRLGGQWMLHIESQRRRVLSLPLVGWPSATSAWIDACRRQQLLISPGAYASQYFCTLTYTPLVQALEQGAQWFLAGDDLGSTLGTKAQSVQDFIAQADYFMSLLSGMLAECRPLTPAETFTYLHTTVTDRWHEVGTLLCWDNLGSQLATSPFWGGVSPAYGDPRLPGTWRLRFLSITGFPHRSMVGVMRALDLAQVEYRWVVRGKGLNKAGQEQFLKRQQHGWGGEHKGVLSSISNKIKGTAIGNEGALDFADDINEARRETWYDLAAYADFTTTIMTWGLTDAEANANAQIIQQAIEDQGFLVKVETDENDAAWLGMQPGNSKDNVNVTPQSMMTLEHLAPGLSTASWRGVERDTWFDEQSGDGLPWLYALSPGNTLLALVNHILHLGHFLLLGATRSGKSTLLNLLRAAWMQYRYAQAMLFDLDGHGRLLTYLLGGYWHDLGAVGQRYAPFQGIEDEGRRALVLEWLLDLLRDFGQATNAIMVSHVGRGLEKLAAQPALKRTMTTLLHILIEQSERATITAQVGHRDADGFANPNAGLMRYVSERYALHKTLDMFTDTGIHKGLFDAPTDDLTSHPIQTFEMRALLDRSSILAPVLRYVLNLHVEPKMSTEAPMLLGFEDAAVAWMASDVHQVGQGMDAKNRQDKIKTYFQTAAKKGVSIGFSTHTLVEVFGGAFGTILQEACPTVFYMPNEDAMKEDIYKIYRRLDLEPPAIQTISQLRRQRDAYITVRGHGQSVVSFPHPPEVLACIARNTKADHARMDRILAEVGRDGFAPAWFRSEGLEEAARFHEEFGDESRTMAGALCGG